MRHSNLAADGHGVTQIRNEGARRRGEGGEGDR